MRSNAIRLIQCQRQNRLLIWLPTILQPASPSSTLSSQRWPIPLWTWESEVGVCKPTPLQRWAGHTCQLSALLISTQRYLPSSRLSYSNVRPTCGGRSRAMWGLGGIIRTSPTSPTTRVGSGKRLELQIFFSLHFPCSKSCWQPQPQHVQQNLLMLGRTCYATCSYLMTRIRREHHVYQPNL